MPSYRDPDIRKRKDGTGIDIYARDKYEAEQWRKKLIKLRCPVCQGKGQVVGQKDAAGIGRWTTCLKCYGKGFLL